MSILTAILLGQVLLLSDGVEPLVSLLVELTLIVQGREDFLDAVLMEVVGRGGPAVIVHPELFPKCDKFTGIAVRQSGHVDPLIVGGLLHLLAVLVNSSEKKNLVTAKPAITRYDIGENLFVGMANVRTAVRVVDRGGNEEFTHALVRSEA